LALTKLHEICQKHQDSGIQDFSLPTIGRLAEAAGIMKGRALYNAKSADYKTLIEGWALFSASQPVAKSPKNNTDKVPPSGPKPRHRIARNYVEVFSGMKIVSKNEEVVSNLELQITLLKAEKAILAEKLSKEVDLRNRPIARPRGRTPLSKWNLINDDIDGLKRAIEPDFLKSQGWKLDSKFQVVNESGKVVFHRGFIQGIRKILAIELASSDLQKENADE